MSVRKTFPKQLSSGTHFGVLSANLNPSQLKCPNYIKACPVPSTLASTATWFVTSPVIWDLGQNLLGRKGGQDLLAHPFAEVA
jgi:hypothetical protein